MTTRSSPALHEFVCSVRTAAEANAYWASIYERVPEYAAVALKPRPLDMQHSLLAVAAAAPTEVIGIVNDNTYQLLAFPQIRGILTVNSSLAAEAAYFDKQVHTLAPLPVTTAWCGTPFVPDSHLSLGDVVLTPDFWRVVLAPYAAVTPADGMRLPPKPNRLRIALDSFWNYHQIDTDRIPRSGYGTIR